VSRRNFITLVGGAAAWPLAARARQRERMRRIGVLMVFAAGDQEVKAWLTAFQEGLQQLGWAQGRNVSIDYRWASDDWDRLQINATELVKMAPDVLFAAATPALAALRQQTRSLPIVFVQVSDPVKLGFVANLARPGGNITGITHDAQIGDATYTITCVPTSTTRPVGIWKNSLASLALRASPMNSRSCQRGMPECLAGLSARRDRKKDVDMIPKCKPCLRATASAWGTFGVSM